MRLLIREIQAEFFTFLFSFAACFADFFICMVIALLTDFGTQDYYVGAMKGAIYSINSRAVITDITHAIEPQNIAAASFTLRACYKDFPPQTIFVAVVDPGVGSHRQAILIETPDYYFIAPDNGLLSFAADEAENYKVYQLTAAAFFAPRVSQTFHGRDVFAPVAAHLSNGVEPFEFGAEIADLVRLPTSAPRKISDREIEADVIHTDRFGNLVTNLKREHLPVNFTIEINNYRISKLQNYFAEAVPGEVFLIIGSAGFLEIAAFQDSAQKILNLKTGNSVRVEKL